MYFAYGTGNSKGACILFQKGQPMYFKYVQIPMIDTL